jgi:hypothetical protein
MHAPRDVKVVYVRCDEERRIGDAKDAGLSSRATVCPNLWYATIPTQSHRVYSLNSVVNKSVEIS